MARPSAEILISADDQATAKFKQVEKSMMSTSKAFKASAGQAKASTEIIGSLATVTAGSGSALSGFAGELAMVTERLSAFSEVADEGGAGALAFKAGIASAAGVLAFKMGKALGDVIFQTEELAEQFEKAEERAKSLASAMAGVTSDRRQREIADLEAIEDQEERRNAAIALRAQLLEDQAAKMRDIERRNREISEREFMGSSITGVNFEGVWNRISGEQRAVNENMRQMNAEAQQWVDASSDYLQELNQIIHAEEQAVTLKEQAVKADQELIRQQRSADRLQGLRDELELLKSKDQTLTRIQQQMREGLLTADDGKAALTIQRQIDAERERIETLKEAERLQQQQAREREREQAALLRKQESEAERKLKEAERLEQRLREPSPDLQATQGRLLTRGDSSQNRPAERTAKAAEKTAERQEKVIAGLQEISRAIREGRQPTLQFEIVR